MSSTIAVLTNKELIDKCIEMEIDESFTFLSDHLFQQFELALLVGRIGQARKTKGKAGDVLLNRNRNNGVEEIQAQCFDSEKRNSF